VGINYFSDYAKVRLSGGLGNQLFQISNAARVSDLHDGKIVLDISWFKHNYMKSNLVSNRSFELDYFPQISKLPTYFAKIPLLDKKIGGLQRRLPAKRQKFLKVMSEKNHRAFSKMPSIIDGVFASKVFIPDGNILAELLQFPTVMSNWLENEIGDLRNEPVVAVHVRMGDYLRLTDIYGVTGLEFYERATNLFRSSNPEVKFHLFSDSPIDASYWLKPVINFDKIIDSPIDSSSAETLRLMSLYKGLITSNSTFSWWAGYLGTIAGTMERVVIPKKFTSLSNDDVRSQFLLDDWEMI